MPGRANATLHRATRLASAGRGDEAAKTIRAALASGEDDIRLLIRLGVITGDFAGLKKKLSESYAPGAGWLFLTMDAYRRSDITEAAQYSQKSLAASPGNDTAKSAAALVRAAQGAPGELAAAAEPLANAAPNVQASALLAAETAIISADPANTGAAEKEDEGMKGPAGWILNRLDDMAIIIYWLLSSLINIATNIATPGRRAVYGHVIRGDLLYGLGKVEKARAAFQRAAEMDPECQEAVESLAALAIQRGGGAEARAMVDRLYGNAGENAGDNDMWTRWKADVLFLSGEFGKAEKYYLKAEAASPRAYIIPYRLGLIALRRGDRERAAKKFERALSLINPGLLGDRLAALSDPG